MAPPPLEFATIQELAPLLARKKLSPVEVAKVCLDRIERLNPKLNAFLTVTAELAMEQARLAERELARGHSRGSLHGIPVTLKDNIYTRDVRTTAGAAILRNFVPDEDATVVRRLRRAGAVLLGKTNLHEFAYGISSENPHFGTVHNPWSTERISGGSSGGAAAAVAAGLCVAAVGTDTGGSIRVPASLCGIVGLKPSFGRISVRGVVPLAPSLDHVGVLTRGALDAAALLEALAGRDPLDPMTVSAKREHFEAAARKTNLKIVLGHAREYYWTQLDPEVGKLAEAALTTFEKEGVTIEEVSLPTLPVAVDAANLVALVEATYVHTKEGWFPTRAAEYGADVIGRLEQGREVRATDYLRALDILRSARAEFESVLGRVDAIVAPTTAIAAPAIGSEIVRVGDAEENVRSALVRLNRPANFTGLPAISIPCGLTRAGLPVGLQLVGRRFGEGRLLSIAHRYEGTRGTPFKHPPLD